jgi:hypothetical protein
MANVWFVGAGETSVSETRRKCTLATCREQLTLDAMEWAGDQPPRFADPDADPHAAHHVVIEITEEEARSEEWKAGYYVSRLTAKEAADRLGLIGGDD